MRISINILFCLAVTLLVTAGCVQANPPGIPIAEATTPTAIPHARATDLPPIDTPVPTSTPTPTPTTTTTPLPSHTPTLNVPFEKVNFTTEDGVDIAATLFGDGDLAVILLHMGKGKATGNDQEDWHPFARSLAEGGYSALTLDFRGRGESGGEFTNDPVTLDAQAALD